MGHLIHAAHLKPYFITFVPTIIARELEQIDQHVESLIFTSSQPISEKELVNSLQKALDDSVSKKEVLASVERLVEKYKSDQYAFEIVPISKGYHFMTKGAFHNTVGEHLKIISKKKLSRAALETLAIIAYKQPVTRIDLEAIRGVGCEYTVQKLMEKELVEMQGRSPGPGRPLLYGTSQKFMDYFGIQDLKDLPKPKDFEMPESEVGEPAPIEVVVPTESTDELASETQSSTTDADTNTNETVPSIAEVEVSIEEANELNTEAIETVGLKSESDAQMSASNILTTDAQVNESASKITENETDGLTKEEDAKSHEDVELKNETDESATKEVLPTEIDAITIETELENNVPSITKPSFEEE